MDFENMNQRDIENLYKSLSTNNFGQIGGNGRHSGGSALIPQSLEKTLKTITFKESHLKLWKEIPKVKAYSTVEEHNIVDNYGEDLSGFQQEGIAGIDTTANYSRDFVKVKCMTTTRSVTDLINRLVRTTENPEALETKNGIMHLLGQAEKALFYGDSTLAPGGEEGTEWDGLLKKTYEGNNIDLRGEDLTDKNLNRASEIILNNYGIATTAYMPTDVASRFSENYYPDQRKLMNDRAEELVGGTVLTKFNTVGGTIGLKPDVFMRRGLIALNPNDIAYGQEAPTPPTLSVDTDTTVLDAKFTPGEYKYAVVAMSNKGKSVPVELATPVVVTDSTATAGVKLTITNSASQTFPPDYFVIYRTEANKNQFYEIARIGAKSRNKSEETVFVDVNDVLPNTAQMIVGDFTQDSLALKELAPMFKLDYAMTAPVKRFGLFYYATPVIYAPKKFVVIKNIKVGQ